MASNLTTPIGIDNARISGKKLIAGIIRTTKSYSVVIGSVGTSGIHVVAASRTGRSGSRVCPKAADTLKLRESWPHEERAH